LRFRVFGAIRLLSISSMTAIFNQECDHIGRGSKKADFRSHSQHKSGHRYQWPSLLIGSVFTLSGNA
jgi:hypothetical protein